MTIKSDKVVKSDKVINLEYDNSVKSDNNILILKTKINIWIDAKLKKKIIYTKPGSILYLLYGKKVSHNSINIKLGYLGGFMIKELIKINNNLELLNCGLHSINNKNIEIDLIFKDKKTNEIYYREVKSNLYFDTEKTEAIINKCNSIQMYLIEKYPNNLINIGILNWTIYNKNILTTMSSQVKQFQKNKIKIDYMNDFLNIINVKWDENDYYTYFNQIGNNINSF